MSSATIRKFACVSGLPMKHSKASDRTSRFLCTALAQRANQAFRASSHGAASPRFSWSSSLREP
eukprot:15059146-Heterocapsa_arctica.AAC.1